MAEIRDINAPEHKAHICNAILRALPSWFGIEASIIEYGKDTQAMPFWAAFEGDVPVGFLALKEHNAYTSEIYVMGVLKEYHRRGIGRELVACCEGFCRGKGVEYLTVKTLDASRESLGYAKTRQFYFSAGFRPLEVFPLHWDQSNPCLFMGKYLGGVLNCV